jgi:hypothetical protein
MTGRRKLTGLGAVLTAGAATQVGKARADSVPLHRGRGRAVLRRAAGLAQKDRTEILLALAAFGILCGLVLGFAPYLSEPDDYAYRASIIAITHGHLLTLSSTQLQALQAELTRSDGGSGPGIDQWVQLAGGRWISEKDPGYPFLAAPFQLAGLIRLAPLFYGALGCLGLFFGARRWLGRFGGAAAVGLFCFSGAALLFAWRDYMPTFTEAALIAAATGALLWAALAAEASAGRRVWVGLLGFIALEAAVFVRYTDIVVLGCAGVAVVAVWWRRAARLPAAAMGWWLGSVAVFGAGVAVFNAVVYGGPLKSAYQPGEITFSLGAILPNLRYMPVHLISAMPTLVLGLAALAWIAWRRVRLAGADGARSDFAVALALAASWLSVWALYAAYTWTAAPGLSTLQAARFYVPAIGAISLLGAWLVARLPRNLPRHVPRRASLAAMTSAALVAAMFGLGVWSFNGMRAFRLGEHTASSGEQGKSGGGVQRTGSGSQGAVHQTGGPRNAGSADVP